jgi:hypothetical protein
VRIQNETSGVGQKKPLISERPSLIKTNSTIFKDVT